MPCLVCDVTVKRTVSFVTLPVVSLFDMNYCDASGIFEKQKHNLIDLYDRPLMTSVFSLLMLFAVHRFSTLCPR